MIIRELTSSEYDAAVPRLAGILVDAVDSGAGVTFMHPLVQDVAEAYWIETEGGRGLRPDHSLRRRRKRRDRGNRHVAKSLAAQPAAPLRSGEAPGAS